MFFQTHLIIKDTFFHKVIMHSLTVCTRIFFFTQIKKKKKKETRIHFHSE